jgi:hypothetical protein
MENRHCGDQQRSTLDRTPSRYFASFRKGANISQGFIRLPFCSLLLESLAIMTSINA